ncbi:MAG: RHS repeat-associated core domain-containing protein [Acidobacteriota bacterium]
MPQRAHTYAYDAENRLVSVDNGATASYKYDHQNRRVSKAVGSSLTHYVWQGSQVIAEHDATTPLPGYGQPPYQVQSARVDYVYAGSRMVYSTQRTSSTGGWTVRYYLSDRLSTRVVLDSSGNVIGRQAHLPFGEDFAESGTQEKHHFTSYERDGESSTDYAVSRQHSGNVGRFMTADPYKPSAYLIDPQSWNRYSYVQNDPVNFTDPTGLFMLAPRFPYDVVIITHPDTDTTPTDTTPPDAKGPGGGAAPSTPLRPGETSERIKSFFDRTPCAQALRNIFGPNATNKIVHKADGFIWYDLMSPENARLLDRSAREFDPSYPDVLLKRLLGTPEQVSEEHKYIAALIMRVSGIVFLGYLWHTADAKGQDLLLVHEILHSYTGLDDVDLATALHLSIAAGDEPQYIRASRAIGNWLGSGCPQ